MEWVALVGLDWGDEKHVYSVIDRQGQSSCGSVRNAPEPFQEWVHQLRRRYPEGTIVVAIEHGRSGLMYALGMYDFIALVPINPRASKRYRESQRLSGASTDSSDAALIREFAMRHLDRLTLWTPDDAATRKIRRLAEIRRGLVDDRTRFSHQLAAALKDYFPQSLEWFGGETSRLLRAVISRWPTLAQLRKATADQLDAVLRAQRCRNVKARVASLLEKIASAVPFIDDAALIEAQSMYAASVARMIDLFELEVAKYDHAIEAEWAKHPDRALFDSLPGAGRVMAPRLAVAFGRDRSRYHSADEVQCYSGIAPVIEQSGKQKSVRARWGYPTFLHQTFHEFAQASLPKSPWARAVYAEQRSRGAKHHQAIRALAFRWIRILFRLWKTGEVYDESRHLASLTAKQSPVARRLAA
jgi:transposase